MSKYTNTAFVSGFVTDYAVWAETTARQSFFLLCVINNILYCHKFNNITEHAHQTEKFNVAEYK